MKGKPINMRKLAWRNIWYRPFRTVILIFMVMLFSVIFLGGNLLLKEVKLGVISASTRLKADLVIVPQGQDQNFNALFLRGKPNNFYLNTDISDAINRLPSVEIVTPQLYISSLDPNSKQQLIGFDQATDFILKPWLKSAFNQRLNDNQIIIGAQIKAKIKDELIFFNHSFKVVAKLDHTGMGFDHAIFMPIEAAKQLIIDEDLALGKTDNHYTSALFVQNVRSYHVYDTLFKIRALFPDNNSLNYVVTKEMVSQVSNYIDTLAFKGYAFLAILWAALVAILFIVATSSSVARKKEINLLWMLGASRNTITKMLIKEFTLISLFASIIGAVFTTFLFYQFGEFLFEYIDMPYLPISQLEVTMLALLTFILTVIIGPLSSIYPALKRANYSSENAVKKETSAKKISEDKDVITD